jgi:serine/threonine protein kinase
MDHTRLERYNKNLFQLINELTSVGTIADQQMIRFKLYGITANVSIGENKFLVMLSCSSYLTDQDLSLVDDMIKCNSEYIDYTTLVSGSLLQQSIPKSQIDKLINDTAVGKREKTPKFKDNQFEFHQFHYSDLMSNDHTIQYTRQDRLWLFEESLYKEFKLPIVNRDSFRCLLSKLITSLIYHRFDIPQFEGIQIDRPIGKGVAGNVYSIRNPGYAGHVIKVFTQEANNYSIPSNFSSELDITARMNHPNIIPALGFHMSNPKRGYYHYGIIYEHGQQCWDYLNRNFTDYTWQTRMRDCFDLLSAIAFLHKNSVLHLDLKYHNIIATGPLTNKKLAIIDLSAALVVNPRRGKLESENYYYTSVEYKNENMGANTDVLILGINLLAIMSGYLSLLDYLKFPSVILSNEKLKRQYLNTFIPFFREYPQQKIPIIIDFFRQIFVIPGKRPSASNLMQHAIFSDLLLKYNPSRGRLSVEHFYNLPLAGIPAIEGKMKSEEYERFCRLIFIFMNNTKTKTRTQNDSLFACINLARSILNIDVTIPDIDHGILTVEKLKKSVMIQQHIIRKMNGALMRLCM